MHNFHRKNGKLHLSYFIQLEIILQYIIRALAYHETIWLKQLLFCASIFFWLCQVKSCEHHLKLGSTGFPLPSYFGDDEMLPGKPEYIVSSCSCGSSPRPLTGGRVQISNQQEGVLTRLMPDRNSTGLFPFCKCNRTIIL